MLTIWWSRTAGIPCVGRSTPVFLHRPTDSWCPSRGFVLTPPPCPPPPPGSHLHGSTDEQRHRDRIENVRHVHNFCHFVGTDRGEEEKQGASLDSLSLYPDIFLAQEYFCLRPKNSFSTNNLFSNLNCKKPLGERKAVEFGHFLNELMI